MEKSIEARDREMLKSAHHESRGGDGVETPARGNALQVTRSPEQDAGSATCKSGQRLIDVAEVEAFVSRKLAVHRSGGHDHRPHGEAGCPSCASRRRICAIYDCENFTLPGGDHCYIHDWTGDDELLDSRH